VGGSQVPASLSGPSTTDSASHDTGPADSGDTGATADTATTLDSDGDGYLDSDELHAGTDPFDPDSVIYEGGWPYAADKDELEEGAVLRLIREGELMLRFRGVDAFGQEVDLWDFKNDEGKYIVLAQVTDWSEPCHTFANWFDGEPWFHLDGYEDVRDAVAAGDVHLVTVLTEDWTGAGADADAVASWTAAHPDPHTLVMADNDFELKNWTKLQAWPWLIVIAPDMTVAWAPPPSSSDYAAALGFVQGLP